MSNVFIHPRASVAADAQIGEGTKIWINSQVRENSIIGRNCNIGKDTYIDSGVKIGSGCKIQNGVLVCHGVVLQDDVFVGPNVGFTNDFYPRAFSGDGWEVRPTLIKRGASIGANATIICGVTLGEFCMVGAGSVVTKNIPAHALAVGNPARITGFVCKCGQKLDKNGVCPKCGAKYDLKPPEK